MPFNLSNPPPADISILYFVLRPENEIAVLARVGEGDEWLFLPLDPIAADEELNTWTNADGKTWGFPWASGTYEDEFYFSTLDEAKKELK